MRAAVVVIALTVVSSPLLAGCGGDDAVPTGPAAEATTGEQSAGPTEESPPPGLGSATAPLQGAVSEEEATREGARQVCSAAGLEALAQALGVTADAETAARAFAEDRYEAYPDDIRRAAYEGCLAGLDADDG